MNHIFENNEIGMQFTGSNLSEVGEFLSGIHFEFTGNGFYIPSPAGNVTVKAGEWLVKRANGTFYTIPKEEEIVPVHHIDEMKTVLTKKPRQSRKKSKK